MTRSGLTYFAFWTVTTVVFSSSPARGQSSDPERSAVLHGVVRDSQNRSVHEAVVSLRSVTTGETRTARTDSTGVFRFSSLRRGTYGLRVETSGFGEGAFGPFELAQKEVKTVDLALAPAFFDEPKFTVAGVAPPTNGGVHASDMVQRSSEALAKATDSLSGRPAVREERGNPLETVQEYQRAAEHNPTEPNLFDWGAELLRHRAADPAIAVFSKGQRLYPHSTRMLLGLGAAFYARGLYDQAAQRLFEACDLNPDDPAPYLFLGKVQSVEITRLAGMTERLARFAGLQSDSAWANYYYGVSLWRQRQDPGNLPTAHVQSLLEKAVRLDPSLGAAYLQLGIVYSERKDFDKAITTYQKAIGTNLNLEELAQAHYRLAQAHEHLGDKLSAHREIAVYHEVSKKAAAEVDRERSEIQQFVFALR